MVCVKRVVSTFVWFLLGGASLFLQPTPLNGQVIVPVQPGNLLTASVKANVTFDGTNSLYTYTYEISSATTSQQEVWFFALEFSGNITNVTSPPGWSFAVHDDRPIVSWAATQIGPLPPDFVDDGNVVPSPFQIKPGQSLGGFTFQSPDPPNTVRFFAQGFTKLPQVTSDVEELPQGGQEIPDFTDDSFIGTSVGPTRAAGTPPFLGGRRPAVDGFLVFTNIASNDTRSAPVAIMIHFSQNGETVDRSTFHATLNSIDVTSAYVPDTATGNLVGVFDLGTSPLQSGRNVLLTTVNGIVPGTTRIAADVDRLVLFVQ